MLSSFIPRSRKARRPQQKGRPSSPTSPASFTSPGPIYPNPDPPPVPPVAVASPVSFPHNTRFPWSPAREQPNSAKPSFNPSPEIQLDLNLPSEPLFDGGFPSTLFDSSQGGVSRPKTRPDPSTKGPAASLDKSSPIPVPIPIRPQVPLSSPSSRPAAGASSPYVSTDPSSPRSSYSSSDSSYSESALSYVSAPDLDWDNTSSHGLRRRSTGSTHRLTRQDSATLPLEFPDTRVPRRPHRRNSSRHSRKHAGSRRSSSAGILTPVEPLPDGAAARARYRSSGRSSIERSRSRSRHRKSAHRSPLPPVATPITPSPAFDKAQFQDEEEEGEWEDEGETLRFEDLLHESLDEPFPSGYEFLPPKTQQSRPLPPRTVSRPLWPHPTNTPVGHQHKPSDASPSQTSSSPRPLQTPISAYSTPLTSQYASSTPKPDTPGTRMKGGVQNGAVQTPQSGSHTLQRSNPSPPWSVAQTQPENRTLPLLTKAGSALALPPRVHEKAVSRSSSAQASFAGQGIAPIGATTVQEAHWGLPQHSRETSADERSTPKVAKLPGMDMRAAASQDARTFQNVTGMTYGDPRRPPALPEARGSPLQSVQTTPTNFRTPPLQNERPLVVTNAGTPRAHAFRQRAGSEAHIVSPIQNRNMRNGLHADVGNGLQEYRVNATADATGSPPLQRSRPRAGSDAYLSPTSQNRDMWMGGPTDVRIAPQDFRAMTAAYSSRLPPIEARESQELSEMTAVSTPNASAASLSAGGSAQHTSPVSHDAGLPPQGNHVATTLDALRRTPPQDVRGPSPPEARSNNFSSNTSLSSLSPDSVMSRSVDSGGDSRPSPGSAAGETGKPSDTAPVTTQKSGMSSVATQGPHLSAGVFVERRNRSAGDVRSIGSDSSSLNTPLSGTLPIGLSVHRVSGTSAAPRRRLSSPSRHLSALPIGRAGELAFHSDPRASQFPETPNEFSPLLSPAAPSTSNATVVNVPPRRMMPKPPMIEPAPPSRRERVRPPLPNGPRKPSVRRPGPGQVPGPSALSNSVTVTTSPPSGASTSASGSPGRTTSSPRFETTPVRWKGLTMDGAKWTFTSGQLQNIVGRAIRQSGEASSIRLLTLEVLDRELPQEMLRLETQREELKARYRTAAKRRQWVLRSLESYVEANDMAACARLLKDAEEITGTLDGVSEDLVSVMDQLSQIQRLRDVHSASALAMALRKLNSSFLKQSEKIDEMRKQVATLQAERNEGWEMAEKVEREFENLRAKTSPGAYHSNRSSRVSAARKSSLRASQASLRFSRTTGILSAVSSPHPSTALGVFAPPVPPVPQVIPARLNTDLPSAGIATPNSIGMSSVSGTSEQREVQDELYSMLGLTRADVRRARSTHRHHRRLSEVMRPSPSSVPVSPLPMSPRFSMMDPMSPLPARRRTASFSMLEEAII